MMKEEKFRILLEGTPVNLTDKEVMEFAAHCSTFSFPLDHFMQIAKTIYQSDPLHCFKFLTFVEKNEMIRNTYKDFQHQPAKIQIYNCLLALTLSRALKETTKQAADGLMSEARKYLNLSIDVKNSAQKTAIMLRSFMTYFNGDFNNAVNIFVKSFHKNNQTEGILSTMSLLGLAEINFVKKDYAKALEYYKKALISNKNLPSKGRLGMGYCFYELQKYDLAELCFQRIIKLDPNCSHAYIGLGVIRFKDSDYDGYFKNIKQAYKLDPKNPLVILHLAQHFFIINSKSKAVQLCQKGLQYLEKYPKFLKRENIPRNDYEQLKARFNNIIGQVHHSNSAYQNAIKFYKIAFNKGLLHNDVDLAKCYIQANMLKEALQILQGMSIKGNNKKLKLVSDMFKTIGYLQVKMQAKPISENGPNYYYKEGLKFHPGDYEALIDYSVYLSQQDKQKNLGVLIKAVQISREEKDRICPQLLNNLGVFQLQNNKLMQSKETLLQSLQLLNQRKDKLQNEDKVKYESLSLTINFNLAIVLEKLKSISESISIHSNLIRFNQYYIDSYVKLAELEFNIGKSQEAFDLLDKAIDICSVVKSNAMRMDKLICMKAHLQHLEGGNLDAKDTLKKLGKNKFQYAMLYDICMGYETVIKKQLEMNMVKDFIRPNRQFLIGICSNDHYNFYSYMLLTVLLIVDHKISSQQASMYFNILKVAELEFPEILFNFGLYQLINDQFDGALFSFHQYREKSRKQKANQFIALALYLKKDYEKCIKILKRNIALEPNNIRFHYQLALTLQRLLYCKFEEGQNLSSMISSLRTAEKARKIYEQFTHLSPGEYMRGVDNPHMKDFLRNQINKIRLICDERLRLLTARLKHYQKQENDLIQKQKKRKEEEVKKYEQLAKVKQTQLLMEQLNDDDEEEQKEKQRIKKRNQYLMERARIEMEEANRVWEDLQELRTKQKDQKKKKRANNGEGKKQRKERKVDKIQEKQKEEQEDYLSEEEAFPDVKSQEYEFEDEIQGEKTKKHKKKEDKKQKKKKKKKEKERKRQKQRERKNEEDEEDNLSSAQEVKSEEQLDEDESEGLPKKKNKNNEEDEDDDFLDMSKYML